jgi:hypothetical protein
MNECLFVAVSALRSIPNDVVKRKEGKSRRAARDIFGKEKREERVKKTRNERNNFASDDHFLTDS